MALSSDLLYDFVKMTKDDNKSAKKESIVYGTVVKSDGSTYVKLDGSDILTPVSSTATTKDGERVTVMIKNHSAIITGNFTSPSARSGDVDYLAEDIAYTKILIADKVSTAELNAQIARINKLESDTADIGDLKADNVTITGDLTAVKGDIETLKANDLTVTGELKAVKADISELETKKLSATDADFKYANIDFSNIGEAAMEYFYANSGLIKNVSIGDATITGELIGVTIKGDLIEGETIVAEKLVIKGEDGLYYKLNTDGMRTEVKQTEYNSLHGSIITANSITATKISVDDLAAFDATIGGFEITENSIYSGVKSTVDNTTRGIYLDNDGQVAFGDSNNFIKFYKDSDGNYNLIVSADSILFGASKTSVEETINDTLDSLDGIASATEQLSQKQTEANSVTEKLSTALEVDQKGTHIFSPGYKNQNEVLVDSDSVDILVGGEVYSSYIPKGLMLGDYMLWQPEGIGGLAFNLIKR